jgi:TetR/AcrR family acrAB operon transcriptional repressor
MARKAKVDAEKTRTKILASALSLFVKKGYENTTFTDVAARLKMTKGAVYWHFESKQALLLALIDEMLEKFSRQVSELLPSGENSFAKLSFTQVADMMVRLANLTVSDPNRRAFFLLMHEQTRWSSSSMDQVREELLKNKRSGPWQAFYSSVANDVHNGKVRKDVDATQVASCCVALWNGLVHSHIANFLACNLEDTLRNAYAAIWRDISKK